MERGIRPYCCGLVSVVTVIGDNKVDSMLRDQAVPEGMLPERMLPVTRFDDWDEVCIVEDTFHMTDVRIVDDAGDLMLRSAVIAESGGEWHFRVYDESLAAHDVLGASPWWSVVFATVEECSLYNQAIAKAIEIAARQRGEPVREHYVPVTYSGTRTYAVRAMGQEHASALTELMISNGQVDLGELFDDEGPVLEVDFDCVETNAGEVNNG